MKKIYTLSFLLISFIGFANAQVTDTVNVKVPGTLNVLAKSFLTTVTNLIVTGAIDARDFKTMRDSMPALTSINLSSVSISAYIGPSGTQSTNNCIYLANSIPQFAFNSCNGLYGLSMKLISIILPPFLTGIEEYAFTGCTGLTGLLTIPASVNYIGDDAFGDCTGLTGNLTLPDSVKTIGEYAFYGCTGLTGSLTIPALVNDIGSNAFGDCTGLTSLTISSSVTSIGDGAFQGCTSLTSIIALNPTPLTANQIGIEVFNGDTAIKKLYVPCGSVIAYQTALQWKNFPILTNNNFVPIYTKADTVVVGSSVTFVADTSCLGKIVSLQWQVNGKNVGKDSSIFNYNPKYSDTITCNATINDTIIKSNAIIMTVIDTSALLAPRFFKYTLFYNNEGNYQICCGKLLGVYGYCSIFSWTLPDTAGKSEKLQYFKIHNINYLDENIIIDSTKDTTFCINVGYMGDLFVTAVYSNPYIESDPSNIIYLRGLPISIKEPDLINNGYIIYPNPNGGNFTLEFPNPENKTQQITITDITGKTVFETTTTQEKYSYAGNKLQSGIYIVTVKGEDSFNVNKMIVK